MNTGTLTRHEIVNSKDSKGNNLFHWAAMIGNHDIIKTLQEYEVNPFEQNQGSRRPLCTALIDDHLEFARKLIQCLGQKLDLGKWKEDLWRSIGYYDDNIMIITGYYEPPILYDVLWKKKVETAKFIMKNTPWKGHFVNELTAALHWAIKKNNKEIVDTLCNTDEFKEVLVAEDAWDYDSMDEEIKKELLKRPDVKSYANRDHQILIQACSLIAVCASILSQGSFQVLLNLPEKTSVVYKILLAVSFGCSIVTVLTVAQALLPRHCAQDGVKVVQAFRARLPPRALLEEDNIVLGRNCRHRYLALMTFLLPRFRASRGVVEETADVGRSLLWAIVLLWLSLFTGCVALSESPRVELFPLLFRP